MLSEEVDINQLKLLRDRAVMEKTVNERVLSLRETYDSPQIQPGSLLRCPKPSSTEFELVSAFYREHKAGNRECGKIIRRMLIPYLRECPNAYRICKSSTDYFLWNGRKFVLNIDLLMFTDPRKRKYNDARALMESLKDGSFFWLGDYEPRQGEHDVVPRMRALARSFEVESEKDNVEPLMLASISEEYCRYVREAKKICAELKIRLNNVQTVLAAIDEMTVHGVLDQTGVRFDLGAAGKDVEPVVFEQMKQFAGADAAKFNEFVDCVSQTFSDVFCTAGAAKYGLVDAPLADDLNLVDASEPISPTELSMPAPEPVSKSSDVQSLRCSLAPNEPYDHWDDTIEILSSMIEMPGWVPDFDEVFDRNIVGEPRQVISKLSLDREISKRKVEQMLASTPRIPTRENTASFRAVVNKGKEPATKRSSTRRRGTGRKASWY